MFVTGRGLVKKTKTGGQRNSVSKMSSSRNVSPNHLELLWMQKNINKIVAKVTHRKTRVVVEEEARRGLLSGIAGTAPSGGTGGGRQPLKERPEPRRSVFGGIGL